MSYDMCLSCDTDDRRYKHAIVCNASCDIRCNMNTHAKPCCALRCWPTCRRTRSTRLDTPLLPLSHRMVTTWCPGPNCLAASTAPTQFIAEEQPTNNPDHRDTQRRIKKSITHYKRGRGARIDHTASCEDGAFSRVHLRAVFATTNVHRSSAEWGVDTSTNGRV